MVWDQTGFNYADSDGVLAPSEEGLAWMTGSGMKAMEGLWKVLVGVGRKRANWWLWHEPFFAG